MIDTNYIGGIVKILEDPNKKFLTNKVPISKVRAQLPQVRNTIIIDLVFWGSLAQSVVTYYRINDFILIEGYLSTRNTKVDDSKNQKIRCFKKIEVTVLKAYPFLLNNSFNKSVNTSI